MARKDPRQPFRLYYQWIALILLGLALGGGIRLATGKTAGPDPPEEDAITPASHSGRKTSSSAPASRRPASPRPPASTAPPLTAEQSGRLLENPTAFQPNLERLLKHADDDPPPQAPEATALAELFGWDENLATDFSATLHHYAATVRQLIDNGAVIDSPGPGVIQISFDEIADEHANEVTDLKERLRGLIGDSDLRRLEGLGFFDVLEGEIGPEQNLLVRLAPAGPLNDEHGERVTFHVFRRSDKRQLAETIVHRGPDDEEWSVHGVSLLPAIDWPHEIERVMDARHPTPE